MGDEVDDAALEAEVSVLAAGPLVQQLEPQAARQEGHLAQPLGQRVELEVGLVEDLDVGPEDGRGAGQLGSLTPCQGAERVAALVLLRPHVPVTAHLHPQVLRQRVHHRDADTVQPAGHLVAVAAELAAGMQLGQHHLDGGQTDRVHDGNGDAAAVVDDRAAAVGMQGYDDVIAVALQRLVDAVIDHLVDEMVEAAKAGRTDVHAGPAANRLEPFKNRDVFGVIAQLCQQKTRLK
jgi:hypothetical protein